MIQEYLDELEETWSYTSEELTHIKQVIAKYAVDAMHDSIVAKEAYNVAVESEHES